MKKINGQSPRKKSRQKSPRVLVAMSGGVDSSVAAQLLKEQGYKVAGVFLHFWKDETAGGQKENRCCSAESLLDARAVAAKLEIPLYTFNFSRQFKKTVVDDFLGQYDAGRTPNPCVVCNKQIKIGLLLKYARQLGFDYVATGHYLNLERVGREVRLFKAKDRNKDQSYFLYTFTPDELKHLLFPLGPYTKPQVRKLAKKFSLKVAAKPESQDICFLSGDHNNFLKRYLTLRPGDIRILDSDEKIGEHAGLPLYTVGQRRGLVGGTGPYYVAKFDYRRNILYVVKNWNEDILYESDLVAKKVNWLSGRAPRRAFSCGAVIRYGHPAVACIVSPLAGKKKTDRKRGRSASGDAESYQVKFSKPQRAVTPGQSVVFYDRDRVLGGGIIA
ncbi:TPA: tRNA 2-thiouridine(34) synthase MnmA [Candidatus Falkowbacteria bacterium]|nr:MAG: tRNA-specific 2-thiouridylase MnmA [Candidatus Falkowbacteria bacterium GW2011_GWF2_43_32]HBA36900.1 tRNA 2-thiouridine(34) synthase MnmA [Candidatus Falkowbacteria bacterium]